MFHSYVSLPEVNVGWYVQGKILLRKPRFPLLIFSTILILRWSWSMFNPKVSRPTFFWRKSYHGVDMKNPELFGHQSLVSNKIEMAIWGNNAKNLEKPHFQTVVSPMNNPMKDIVCHKPKYTPYLPYPTIYVTIPTMYNLTMYNLIT